MIVEIQEKSAVARLNWIIWRAAWGGLFLLDGSAPRDIDGIPFLGRSQG